MVDQVSASPAVNVIGNLSGSFGLGVVARNLITAVAARGSGVSGFDLGAGDARHGLVRETHANSVPDTASLPDGINLFVLPPQYIASEILESDDLVRLLMRPRATNVLFTFWELPVLPDSWVEALQLFPIVVAPSTYIEGVLDFRLSGTRVLRGLTPVAMTSDVRPNRKRFGIPDDVFVALASFDPLSDIERKNPLGALQAFQRAFPGREDVRMVFKLNTPRGGYRDVELNRRLLEPLLNSLRSDRRVIVMAESLPYEEVLSLYASADTFVSLHRAEGLGLGLLESMALAKPVIATDWSGNRTFMTPSVSCLVRHRLVAVRASHDSYTAPLRGLRPFWAEPDLDDAASWLRQLATDPDLRKRVGLDAYAAAQRYRLDAGRLEFLDDIIALRHHQLSAGCDSAYGDKLRQSINHVRRQAHRASLGPLARLQLLGREQFARQIGWRFARSSGGMGTANGSGPRDAAGVANAGAAAQASARGAQPKGPDALPSVWVVVLNWNGRCDTLACLDSLRVLTYSAARTVVVDNGSTDGSVAAIRQAHPWAEVIETGRNLGFAEGNNVGIRHAVTQDAEYVLLLNNDAVAAPDLVERLLDAARLRPDGGVFGAKILFHATPNRVWYFGARWDPSTGLFEHVGLGDDDDPGRFGEIVETDYVCGCALFVRRAVIERTGVMDATFFLTFEEADWCYRARNAGFRSYVVPHARVWHKVSASFGGAGSPLAEYFLTRNRLLFARRHFSRAVYRRVRRQSIARLLAWSRPDVGVFNLVRSTYWQVNGFLRNLRGPADPQWRAQWLGLRDHFLRRYGDCPDEVRLLGRGR